MYDDDDDGDDDDASWNNRKAYGDKIQIEFILPRWARAW